MKISLNWLSDFVDITEKDPQKIADAVTAHVAEIDEVEVQGQFLDHCCVGEVLTVEKHPNADKLNLCDVQTDKGKKRVVCGGTNLRVGMKVAFAHIGATVKWHGADVMTLEPVKIRGEKSEGMVCAGEELGLDHLYPATKDQGERPIVELPADAQTGTSLREYTGMSDTVLHVDNHAITHRPDLFSHVGFAVEFAAIGLGKMKGRIQEPNVTFGKEPVQLQVKNEIPDLIPRYCSCMIQIDSLGETPDWMKKRLIATGWRPVSLPVDITNYVATEWGMPLHSFDADDLSGTIRMRAAKKGEKITTLDDVERELWPGAIVLSDDKGIFDLLGIMGGLRSSTKESTRRIYLHAAIVDPVSIRRAMIAMGHRTDAGTVYEKGVPRVVAEAGLKRAAQLMLELIPGAKIVSAMETWGDDGSMTQIQLSHERVQRVLGAEIAQDNVASILQSLGFEVDYAKGQDQMTVRVPLWRLKDVTGQHDLIEEVGRIYGYNTIESALPAASIAPPKRDFRLQKIRHALKEDRFLEILPLSFVSPALLKKA